MWQMLARLHIVEVRLTDTTTHWESCIMWLLLTIIGLGMCGKSKFGSDSVFKTEQPKNLTSVQTVSDRNCMQSII